MAKLIFLWLVTWGFWFSHVRVLYIAHCESCFSRIFVLQDTVVLCYFDMLSNNTHGCCQLKNGPKVAFQEQFDVLYTKTSAIQPNLFSEVKRKYKATCLFVALSAVNDVTFHFRMIALAYQRSKVGICTPRLISDHSSLWEVNLKFFKYGWVKLWFITRAYEDKNRKFGSTYRAEHFLLNVGFSGVELVSTPTKHSSAHVWVGTHETSTYLTSRALEAEIGTNKPYFGVALPWRLTFVSENHELVPKYTKFVPVNQFVHAHCKNLLRQVHVLSFIFQWTSIAYTLLMKLSSWFRA